MPEFKEFRVGELFGDEDFEAIKQAKSQGDIPNDENLNTSVPYIVQSNQNNMFSRRVNKAWLIEHNEPPVSGNRIALGVTLPAVSFQPEEFGASQVITIKSPKLNRYTGNYIVTAISKHLVDFSYGNKPGLKIYKNMKITLPVTTEGFPDWQYMSDYVKKIEADYVKKIEAYLQTLGYSDVESVRLTETDREVLYRHENAEFADFFINELFEVINTHSILKEDVVFGSGKVPYVTATEANNAVTAYIEYESNLMENGDCILIGGKTLVITYQYNNFFSNDSHNLALYWKLNGNLTKEMNLYFVSALQKSMHQKYTWGNSISKKKIAGDKVTIPIDVATGRPDTQLMEDYIKVIEKKTVASLVTKFNKRSNAYQEIINSQSNH
ncbi:restriction endonuclease subunit S [Weissella viridescens]|uniref:Type II restriction modification enzyme methyltransferase n=2 Tax=Weissella viridescens TaxID=1629 RepID=A0A0R2GZL6_WEIVI|nr:restriction endonuclease subunit S [Weissella viridescens]KRN46201.1 type II restriction modification enzyme methyltransferase [Weissella viridescens]